MAEPTNRDTSEAAPGAGDVKRDQAPARHLLDYRRPEAPRRRTNSILIWLCCGPLVLVALLLCIALAIAAFSSILRAADWVPVVAGLAGLVSIFALAVGGLATLISLFTGNLKTFGPAGEDENEEG